MAKLQQLGISIPDIYQLDQEEGGLELVKKLQEWSALPKEEMCIHCDKPMTLEKDDHDGFKWRCSNMNKDLGKECHYSASLTAGTIFDNLNVLMRATVLYARMFTCNVQLSCADSFLREDLSPESEVSLFDLFRAVCFHEMTSNLVPIGGPDCTVEIVKRKYNKSKDVGGHWVFGGYCLKSGSFLMVPMAKPDKANLFSLIQQWILPGTEITTDNEAVYRDVPTIYGGSYRHKLKRHSFLRTPKEKFDDSDSIASYSRGNLAKYLFIRKCSIQKWDSLAEFFKAAGRIAFPLSQDFLDELHALTDDQLAERQRRQHSSLMSEK